MIVFLLIILFFLPAAAHASISDIYIAQSSSGSANGSSCANADAYTFFNTSGNWGSGSTQIGPGSTVHLCGTIANALTAQGSGSSGSPITIYFESGAALSSPLFPITGALSLSGKSWFVVNGGIPCGPSVSDKSTCNGIIENTANGTGLANHTDQTMGIELDGTTNITIENLVISDIYVRTSDTDENVPSQPNPSGINVTGTISNLVIHDTTMHDANWMLSFASGSVATGLNIYNVDIYNSDHCFAVGTTTQTDSNIQFHDSHCHDGANWDDPGADKYHHDGVHLYSDAGTGGKINSASVYNNLFDGNWGTQNTAAIFLESNSGSSNGVNATIYNNVFLQDSTNFNWNNGFINLQNLTSTSASQTDIYNNTFIADTDQSTYCVQLQNSVDFRNNVIVTPNTATGIVLSTLSGVTGTIDYNAYASTQSTPFYVSGSFTNYSAWKALGWDAHSVSSIGTPPYDLSTSTGAPSSGFPGIGAAVNLSALGITALNSDTSDGDSRSPVARPSTGAWDIGAYQYSGSAPASAPAPAFMLLSRLRAYARPR